MNRVKRIKPRPGGAAGAEPMVRKNQTQLIMPTDARRRPDLESVVKNWLVPALVERFVRSQVRNQVSDDDRTSGTHSRGEMAASAETQC